ncbi:MAG: ABC transporter substrate-binding protein, partial [Nostoc sp.]
MKLVKHHRLKPIIFLCQFFLIATLIIACHTTAINTFTNTNNNGCIQKYDSNTDYFPNKIQIT